MINFKKERILITGASGFIGSNLIRALSGKEAEIFAININEHKADGVKSQKIDLAGFDKVKAFIDEIKPTVVFHLGALVVLSRDFQTAQMCVDSNIKGTLNLLEAVKDLKLKRFLFMSTEEVYGRGELPFKEDQLPMPPSPYAVSKAAGENFCQLYFRLYHLPVTIFRINTIYGPFQPESRFIPTLINKALANQPIDFNSGKNKRDYLFVDDLIEAIILTMKSDQNLSGEIFNIGTGEAISGKKLAEKVLKLIESSSKINFGAFPDREGEAPEWRVDNSKARKILNWRASTSLEKGLLNTISYYEKGAAENGSRRREKKSKNKSTC